MTPPGYRSGRSRTVPLDAGAYLIVFASGQQYPDKVDANGNLHATFRLSAEGEYLALVDPAGHIRQQFSPGFPAATVRHLVRLPVRIA